MLPMARNIMILIELLVSLYCLAKLFGKKLRLNIYIVVLALVDMFIMTAVDEYGFPSYFISILHVCIFLYALSYYREGIKRTVINFFLMAVIMSATQLIIFMPLYLLYYKRYNEINVNELLITVLSLIIIVLLSLKIDFKKISDFFVKRNKLITGIAVLSLFWIIGNIYKMRNTGDLLGETYVQLVFLVFIFAYIVYEWQKSRVDAEKKRTQLEMNSLYYDAYDQLIMLIRERQHDMKNHINTILSMVYTIDNYDELVSKQAEYCNHVMEGNEKTRLVLAVDNPLIAGFLYSKIQEAEKNEIRIDYSIKINKTTVVIPEYELIDMAGILIDNAIDALSTNNSEIVEVKKKIIYVSMKETKECLELTVANTSDYFEENVTEHFFEAGYSSKGNGRGIGLAKLKRMVHEKTGNIIVSNEKYNNLNYLQFSIIIPMKIKGRKNLKDDN